MRLYGRNSVQHFDSEISRIVLFPKHLPLSSIYPICPFKGGTEKFISSDGALEQTRAKC